MTESYGVKEEVEKSYLAYKEILLRRVPRLNVLGHSCIRLLSGNFLTTSP